MLFRVNFFGHACVASWYETTPGFVLGAMLPDFAGMLRLRIPTTIDADLLRGVDLHHATDASFHALGSFVELVRRSRQELLRAGLAAGPARAVAHVGVELLIDEVLVMDPLGREAYLDALNYAKQVRAAAVLAVGPTEREASARWTRLIETLGDRGAPECAPEPTRVAERLARALSARPRLAIDSAGERLVGNWVVSARPNVVGYVDTIVAELRLRLDAAGFPRAATDRPLCLG